MFSKFLRRKKEYKAGRIISVAGVKAECGVTNFCIAFANYLTNVKGKEVALVEFGDKSSFSFLTKSNQKMKNGGSVIKGIVFYPKADETWLPMLLSYKYDYIILDMGNEYLRFKNEFLRSNLSVAICDFCSWKRYATLAFFSETKEARKIKEIVCLYAFGSSKNAEQIGKVHSITPVRIPVEYDPLCIESENFAFYENVLKQVK